MSGLDFVAANPDFAEIHAAAMAASSALFDSTICQVYDFSKFRCLVDVGGGQLIADILSANKELHGILFDLPHIVAHAPQVLTAADVADRCRIQAGSFFESVPSGGDA
jgi:hypothetical protein